MSLRLLCRGGSHPGLPGTEQPRLLNRPAAVPLYHLINLLHQLHRLLERHDETLIVGNVFRGERVAGGALFAAPVVEPLVADLIAADVDVPHVCGDAVEVGTARPPGGVQVDFAVLVAFAFAEDAQGGAVDTLDEGGDGVLGINLLPRLAIILVWYTPISVLCKSLSLGNYP